MKKLLLLFIFASFTVQAQVHVGIRDYLGEKTKANDPKVYDKIKGGKILFVLPDIYSEEEYKKVLNDSWKFSDYELVSIKDFNENPSKYLKVSTVVAEYNGMVKTRSYTSPNKIIKNVDYVFIDIVFYVIDDIKVGKKETKYEKTFFGQISFCPDYPKMGKDGLTGYANITPNYLRNYKLGYLKNYFTIMSKGLSEKKVHDGYADFVNNEQLRKLKTQKLYITEDVKDKSMGLFNRDDRDLNKLTEDYQFEKVFVTVDELNKKILSGEEIYYLFYNQDNSKKIVSVVNSKTGEVIYNTLDRMAFVLKEKDFKEVNKAVSKS